MNAVVETLMGVDASTDFIALTIYDNFKQAGKYLTIGITNTTRDKLTLNKGTKVAKVYAANLLLPIYEPIPQVPQVVIQANNAHIAAQKKGSMDSSTENPYSSMTPQS